MPEMRLAGGEVDGLDIHYVVQGRGPALVLVHGLGGFAESWRHTIAALSERATVIALDLPGFGQSAKPPARYRLEFLASAVLGVMDGLGWERASLVGHSIGGAVAVACALARPARVDRLALLGAAVPGFPLRPSMLFRLLMLPGVGELMATLVTPALCEATVARCFHAPARDEVAYFVRHGFEARSTPPARAAYLAVARSVRRDFTTHAAGYRAALEALERPMLVVHGRQDPVVPVEHAEVVARGLPQATARWLERCGHFPQVEHAAAVNAWLAAFLAAPTPR